MKSLLELVINVSEDIGSMVRVHGLRKYFGKFGEIKAVDGISFEIRSGEVFGLLGPNGAGKTTTIKLLLGLLEPLEGMINIFGLDPQRDDVKIKEEIGYASEVPLMFKALTPSDLFNFIASIRKLDGEEASRRAQDYLESLGAIQYYYQVIETLSRGNKQKVQLVAAFLHEPKLLILDEPFAGLDAKSVKVVKELIEIHVERGGAVLFSTHIMEVAQEICDRIAIINKGKLVGMGTIEQLRQQADKIGANLEDVFLRLTDQDTSVDEIVKKLRKTFKKKN